MTDALLWCDEYLPDLYDMGMFDEEDTHDAVWEAFESLVTDTILDLLDDPVERDILHDQLLDAAQEWFRVHHELMIESLSPDPPTALLSRPQTDQHSADWYAQRSQRLTASEFSQILDGRRTALLRTKVLPTTDQQSGGPSASKPIAVAQPDGEMTATMWGHRFESVTRAIYEQELAGPGTVNDTLGRFQHQTIPWLSASPDGVVVTGDRAGRLVEIKSPKTRQPGEFVPSDYYAQMQIQMEVCDAEAVDFVEAQFAQRPVFHYMMGGWTALSEEDDAAIRKATWKGRIRVYGNAEVPASWIYRYTPPVEDLDDATLPSEEGLTLLEESIWWLTGFYPRTVLRNRTWWEETGWPAASLFWAEVESCRADPSCLPTSTRVTVIKEDADPIPDIGYAFRLPPAGGCGMSATADCGLPAVADCGLPATGVSQITAADYDWSGADEVEVTTGDDDNVIQLIGGWAGRKPM
jgi:putative phage-type endonuclease